jgi:hypothetical protein
VPYRQICDNYWYLDTINKFRVTGLGDLDLQINCSETKMTSAYKFEDRRCTLLLNITLTLNFVVIFS